MQQSKDGWFKMYKITNLGQSVRVIHDKLNRGIKIAPATTVAVDLNEPLVKILMRAMETGGDLKIVAYNGEQTQPAPVREPPRNIPEPDQDDDDDDDEEEVDDSQGRMHDGVEPEPEKKLERPRPPKSAIAKKKPFKSHGRRIARVGREVQALKEKTLVLDDGVPKDPEKMSASQVLAQVGKQGFTYTELLKHSRRLLGADSLPPRPSEHDLLQRLRRHAVKAGK